MLTDLIEAVAQARALMREGKVRTATGETLALARETLCVHGDKPSAEKILAAVAAD